MTDLAVAMGINAPSIYATFGNKDALFREGVRFYVQKELSGTLRALNQPSCRKAFEDIFRETVVRVTHRGKPRGCMVVLSAAIAGEENADLATFLRQQRITVESALRDRLFQGMREGELPDTTNPEALALLCRSVLDGLSIQAVDGASRIQLLISVGIFVHFMGFISDGK